MGRLHRRGIRQIEERFAEIGVSLREHYVLSCIGETDGVAQQQVADLLGLDRSDLVKVLDRLEGAGLVLRKRDTVDRRRHVLTLTVEGRVVVAKADGIASAVTGDLLSSLSKPEQDDLHRLLLKALG